MVSSGIGSVGFSWKRLPNEYRLYFHVDGIKVAYLTATFPEQRLSLSQKTTMRTTQGTSLIQFDWGERADGTLSLIVVIDGIKAIELLPSWPEQYSLSQVLAIRPVNGEIEKAGWCNTELEAPQVEGYRFLVWVATCTNAWCGCVYSAAPTNRRSQFFTATNAEGNKPGELGSITAYALYMRSQHSLSQINGAYIEQAYINASGKMTVEILSEASNHAGFLIWLDGNNYPVLASIGGQSTKIFMGYLEVKRISNTKFELTNTPWSYGFVMSAYPMIVKSIQFDFLIVIQLFPSTPIVVLLDSHETIIALTQGKLRCVFCVFCNLNMK